VGIATIAGVGYAGSSVAEGDGPRAAAIALAPRVEAARAASTSLWLDVPAHRDVLVTSPQVIVRGRTSSAITTLWIVMESSNGKPVAARTIDVSGTPRDGQIPFESRFRLSMPRPAGRLTVMVVAVGSDGVPVDAVRRRFQLGAVVDTAKPWRH
jgi:hypothetical protein